MAHLVVLSHYQAKPLLAARRALLDTATISPDLNRTMVAVRLSERGVGFPNGELLAWRDVERIAASENTCYLVSDGEIQPVQVFSETTNWMRSLYPTAGAPTTLVAGFPMHRIKDTDPYEDTLKKIAALAPVTGNVLDTTTGLGYTAIEAARTAQRVTTLELDPAALEIARLNPWSQDLFENPRIEVMIADAFERIRECADEAFTCVLHDPPTFSLAGELYSEDFYRQLYRVLAPRGRLFHYVGDPTSKLGRRMTTSVVQRLQESGFRRVIRKAEAFGVVANK